MVALVVGIGLLLAPSAFAHTELVSSSPADGATLTRAPSRVVLTFDEAVSTVGAAIVVTAPDGTRVDSGPTAVDGATVRVALDPLSDAGRYTVAYRVVADDGHPETATLTFTYQDGAEATATPTPTAVSASPAAADPSSAGGSATAWIVGAVALVVIVTVAWLSMRRRGAHGADGQ
jgi:methionine-rich copper-binding protein CopC